MELDLPGGREREVRQPDEAPGGSMKTDSQRFQLPPPTHQEFGPGSARRCVICWRPAWARGLGLWLPLLCAASAQRGHWGWVHPVEAVSANRSLTRTVPWHGYQGERRPSSILTGLLGSECHSSHQPGPSLYSALPSTNPWLLATLLCDCRARSFPDQEKILKWVIEGSMSRSKLLGVINRK